MTVNRIMTEEERLADERAERTRVDRLKDASKAEREMKIAVRFAERTPNPWELSVREVAVIRAYVSGLSNRGVSEKLCLSPKTVSTYLTRVKEKMETTNTFAAMFKWHLFEQVGREQVDGGGELTQGQIEVICAARAAISGAQESFSIKQLRHADALLQKLLPKVPDFPEPLLIEEVKS